MGFANFRYGILAAGSITSNFFIMVKKIDDNLVVVLSNDQFKNYEDIRIIILSLIDYIAFADEDCISQGDRYTVLSLLRELLPSVEQVNYTT